MRDSLSEDLCLQHETLTLKGRQVTIDSGGTPSFLGIRQTEPAENFSVVINTDTTFGNGKIGILSLINDNHFAAILVKKKDKPLLYHVIKKLKMSF